MDTLLIEVDEETTLEVHLDPAPELVFETEGIQGPPGGEGQPGADIGGYDPGDLTLIFENQLI